MRSPFIGLLFILTVALCIIANRWTVFGLPIRSLVTLATLAWIWALHERLFTSAVRACGSYFIMIGLVGALGFAVSLLNGSPFADIVGQVVEIHVQAVCNILLASCVIGVIGRRFVLVTFIAVVVLTSLVAVLQGIGIDAAWTPRALLGVLQHDAPMTARPYLRHERAMGLSLTPILLASQVCLALVAVCEYRFPRVKIGRALERVEVSIDRTIIWAILAALFVCFASGNRSPILGIVVFATILAALRRPIWLALLIPAALLLVPLTQGFVQSLGESGVRAVQVENGSSVGRLALMKIGMLEFIAQPYGYGLLFDSTQHADQYWGEIADMDNAQAVANYALHNYFLVMLNKYGILIIFAGWFAVRRMMKDPYVLLFFLPYILHIAFHNDGPLTGDFLIWFLVAPSPVLPHKIRTRRSHPENLRLSRARETSLAPG